MVLVRISGLELPTNDLDALCTFYCDALGFKRCSQDETSIVIELGGTFVRLRYTHGRPIPVDSRSHDRWFRHIAISVRHMQPAYQRLRDAGVSFVSEPVRLPNCNAAVARIEAAYLRDPERHPLELIKFPPGKGHDNLKDYDRSHYLGIDHTAIVVADTARAKAFYRERCGLEVEMRSHNFGPEQARLSGLEGADVLVTSLRGQGGIGLELLQYLAPTDGRNIPADTNDNDLWSGVTCLTAGAASPIDWAAAPLTCDLDGHRVRI